MNVNKYKNMFCSLAMAATLVAGILLPTVSTFAANPPDTMNYSISTAIDDSMDVTVSIEFDENVYLSGAAESDFNVTIAGAALSTSNLDYEVIDTEPCDPFIEIKIYDIGTHSAMYKMDNLTVTPTGSGSTLPHVLACTNNTVAVWDLSLTNKIIPSNFGITHVGSTNNSVTYEITHKPNIRSMIWLRLKDNGSVVSCTSQYNPMSGTTLTIPAWANGSFVIHSHNYTSAPLSDYAQAIADVINASTTVGIYNDYTASASGNYITIYKGSNISTLSLEVYNYTLQ